MKGLLGKKVGMTQIFTEQGEVIPVTVVEAGPVVVTQIKTTEKDGYTAIQVGFEDAKEKALNKPQKGHLAAANTLKKHLKEFRVDSVDGYEVYRADKNGAYKKVATIKSAKTLKWIDKNVKKGYTYKYKVRAYAKVKGKTYYSAYSAEKAVKVK